LLRIKELLPEQTGTETSHERMQNDQRLSLEEESEDAFSNGGQIMEDNEKHTHGGNRLGNIVEKNNTDRKKKKESKKNCERAVEDGIEEGGRLSTQGRGRGRTER